LHAHGLCLSLGTQAERFFALVNRSPRRRRLRLCYCEARSTPQQPLPAVSSMGYPSGTSYLIMRLLLERTARFYFLYNHHQFCCSVHQILDTMAPNKIIIDTDPVSCVGRWGTYLDIRLINQGVDDILAMMLAFAANPEELEILMVSLTFGNVEVQKYVIIFFHILRRNAPLL
jgi:hypothetical protein